MENLFDKTGDLSVALGKGYLSTYEISNLSVGDIIQSSMIIGNPCPIYFNNELFCFGEIIISENLIGTQISKFVDTLDQASFPGVVDELTEVLPFTINLIQMKFSLKELKGVTINSIILGKENDQTAELFVAGFAAAKGHVVICGENYGIEIIEVYTKHESVSKIRQSNYLLNKKYDHKKIMYYDFAKPDMVSMGFIISIGKIHDYFCRNMKIQLESLEKYIMLEVDQKPLENAINDFGEMNNIYLFDTNPESRSYLTPENQDLKNDDVKFIAVSRDIVKDLDENYISELSKWLQENRKKPDRSIIFSVSPGSSMNVYKNEDDINQFILDPLRNAWRNYVSLNFRYGKLIQNKDEVKIVPENNMILYVKIGDPDNKKDFCELIYPFTVLDPVIEVLEK